MAVEGKQGRHLALKIIRKNKNFSKGHYPKDRNAPIVNKSGLFAGRACSYAHDSSFSQGELRALDSTFRC
jgi:hypothetical protein